MNKYDYAIEAIKIIVEQCTLMKIQFSESVKNLLDKAEKHLVLPKIPQKRPPASPRLNKKHSLSSSSDKSGKLRTDYAKKKVVGAGREVDEEGQGCESESSDLEKTLEIGSLDELEKRVLRLETSKNFKEDLKIVENIFRKLRRGGVKKVKAFRDVFEVFEGIKRKVGENKGSYCLDED